MFIKYYKGDRVKTKRTSNSIMLEFFGACMVLFLSALIYYCIKGGADTGKLVSRLIANFFVAMSTSFLVEALNVIIRMDRHTEDKKSKYSVLAHMKKYPSLYLDKILRSYFYVSPIIMILVYPIYTPCYVIFVSTLVGVLFAKVLFGGFGQNVFNPALAGRIFGGLCFGTQLTNATVASGTVGNTIQTGATVTTIAQNAGWVNSIDISTTDLLIGNYRGALGEPFAIILIILGIFLCVRKVIDYRLALTYILSFFLMSLLMGAIGGVKGNLLEFALRNVCYGGVLIGGVFCLTDPVTSPVSGTGKVIYALIASVLTFIIRYLGSAPEGVAYSILLANFAAPAIDRFLSHKSNHKMWAQYTAIASFGAVLVVTACCTGNYLKDENKEPMVPPAPTSQSINLNKNLELAEPVILSYSQNAVMEGNI